MRKYAVPYTVSYDNFTRHWETKALSAEHAREIVVEQLSTDEEVTRIASVKYIIDLGEEK